MLHNDSFGVGFIFWIHLDNCIDTSFYLLVLSNLFKYKLLNVCVLQECKIFTGILLCFMQIDSGGEGDD